MKGTLISAVPAMKDGAQKSFGSHGSLLYVYKAQVMSEGGVMFQGEVNSKTADEYPIKPNTVIEFVHTEDSYGGKLKISIPKDGAGYSSAPAPKKQGYSGGGSSWSPEKEASVMVQGFLKSIVESGQKSEHWELAARKMLQIHDKLVAERAPAAPVAPHTPPPPPAQPYQHPYAVNANIPPPPPPVTGQIQYRPEGHNPNVYQGAPPPPPVGDPDDGLPF